MRSTIGRAGDMTVTDQTLGEKISKKTISKQEYRDLVSSTLPHVIHTEAEDEHYALKPATPVEILTELMAANDLRQKDLVDIFGTPSIVSEVLSGKRQLTTEHIRRLAERFHVSPELFI